MGEKQSKSGSLLTGEMLEINLKQHCIKTDHKGEPSIKLSVKNDCHEIITLCWLDQHGAHYHFRQINAGAEHTENCFRGHVFVFYKLNRAVSDLHSLREKHPSFTDLALSHAFGEQPICAYRPLENALHKLTLKSNRTLSEGKTEFSASFSAKVPFEWNDIFCLKPFCLLPVIDSTSKIYEEFEVEGLKVNAESGVFEKYPELHDELKKDICHNKEVLPPSAWNVINSNTCLWLNDTMQYGPKRNPTFGRGMCVHPGKNWLVENGMSPKKLNGIEIYSAREYLEERKKYPLYLLHEMAHVFHLHYPEGGYDNKEIIQVYDAAMRSGCYEKVTLRGHDQDVFFKAYACENQMEYFAEISTAFFSEKESDRSGNKWSPYTKSELKQIDTEGFELCNKVWNISEQKYKITDR